jgi:hypothetical protein
LSAHWDAIEKVAPKVDGSPVMPKTVKRTRRGRRSFEELGCGYYGCVIESSSDSNLVFKLTSDASEAAFVSAALDIGDLPDGMIRYDSIIELPEKYRRRRVFAIWREEASMIGFPMLVWQYGAVTDRYTREAWKELLRLLDLFLSHAAIVRNYVKKASDKVKALGAIKEREDFAWRFTRDARAARLHGADRAAVSLQHCEDVADEMYNTFSADTIGGALSFYMKRGLLLADVHANNVGVATRPPDEHYDDWHAMSVITDPGHMVPLDPKWLDVKVPQL